MSVLLLSHALDFHSAAVMWALERRRVESTLWDTAEFPATQCISVRVGSGSRPACHVRAACGDIAFDRYRSVWIRRPGAPRACERTHGGDVAFVERESAELLAGMRHLLSDGPLWVNPPHDRLKAMHKPVQLQQALEVGLEIPPTLISNSPDDVRSFFREHRGQVIYKPFMPATWQGPGTARTTYTTRLDEAALERDFAVRACPGIYQPYVPKAYELRIVVIGSAVFGAALESQTDDSYADDWRRDLFQRMPVKAATIPPRRGEQCLELMGRLGLRFGCLDFIVRPDGHWVFLEVNEMGQFLWLEQRDPSLPLLDAFADFLAAGDPGRAWRDGRRTTPLAEFIATQAGAELSRRPAATTRATRAKVLFDE